jgi:hypothetical protein
MYDTPRCSQMKDGQPCNYPPVNKCKKCGRLICLEHSHEYRSPNGGADYAIFNGIYCPSCLSLVGQEHDQKVVQDNENLKTQQQKQQACECMNCGCQGLSKLCGSL